MPFKRILAIASFLDTRSLVLFNRFNVDIVRNLAPLRNC